MKTAICSVIILLVLLMAMGLRAQEYQFSTESKKAHKLYKKAEEAYLAGEADQSREYLLKSIREDTTFTEAYLLLGDIYLDIDQQVKAEEAYRQAVDIDPDFFPHAYYLLGNIQLALKKYPEAEESFKAYLEFPDLKTVTRRKVQQILQNIRFRAEAYRNPVPFEPVRLGDSINTAGDEYINALSTDEAFLFFTRRIKIAENRGRRSTVKRSCMPVGWTLPGPMCMN
ncbi:MAG: tetratricopeptide repeat protein [Bacteroidota bacterium]|nr:tetratricopeptide repeat protein [Bacteroidota bacterium]